MKKMFFGSMLLCISLALPLSSIYASGIPVSVSHPAQHQTTATTALAHSDNVRLPARKVRKKVARKHPRPKLKEQQANAAFMVAIISAATVTAFSILGLALAFTQVLGAYPFFVYLWFAVLLLGILACIVAFWMGFYTLQRIRKGETDKSARAKAIVAMILGGAVALVAIGFALILGLTTLSVLL